MLYTLFDILSIFISLYFILFYNNAKNNTAQNMEVQYYCICIAHVLQYC